MKKHLSIFCLISLIVLTFCFSSCSGDNGDNADKDYYDRDYPVKVGLDFEGGFLYSDFDEGIIKVFDYESRSLLPFCAKPNCLHNSEDCTAVRKYDSYIFIYHNKLYSLFSEVEAIDAAVGRLKTTVTVSDIDGNNEKVFAKFDGNFETAYPSYIFDGILYLTAEIHNDIDIAEGTSYSSADYSENKLLKRY